MIYKTEHWVQCLAIKLSEGTEQLQYDEGHQYSRFTWLNNDKKQLF